ncbi:MAG: bifunctional oligoribonuclease/PAP phosphatase NrnA, partial [Candidatus Fimimonas sp.]
MSTQLEIMQQILQKIESYDKIIITRHLRPDGDAIGSTKGLRGILKLTYPQKDVRLLTEDSSDYLAFLGGEDEPVDDDFYRDALVIVIDSATLDRVSNSRLGLAKEVIKIDHHIDIKPYGDLCWIEDWRSSSAEMIAFFYRTFSDKLKMDKETATYIFCGMVTDSGRFRYESTTGDTLRLAAML